MVTLIPSHVHVQTVRVYDRRCTQHLAVAV